MCNSNTLLELAGVLGVILFFAAVAVAILVVGTWAQKKLEQ